jgi:hypothetical protein
VGIESRLQRLEDAAHPGPGGAEERTLERAGAFGTRFSPSAMLRMGSPAPLEGQEKGARSPEASLPPFALARTTSQLQAASCLARALRLSRRHRRCSLGCDRGRSAG